MQADTAPAPAVRGTDDGNTEYDAAAPADDGSECSRVEIEKTVNGGFTVRKFCKPPANRKSDIGYMEPQTYAFTSFAEMTSFLGDAFGESAEPPAAPNMSAADESSAT